ncbi:nitroreductase family protein [Microcella daejeonensis]|uniref:Nitroreductase family protein n=1 Tax=Microcella daejeonensis TaxID=2994971 RepID=A0A9E8S9N9_9MICO|nr:nitroreductase family protein [Microcella daejeonensis]WAB82234.1 nitroreductase family protein [Microcella daejeonensis]WAB84409.1 nitroreductase family protein [Microcella daejeonensis]
MSLTTTRRAETAAPILDVLAERWSTRAFAGSPAVDAAAIDAMLEAARWSPSANNSQPWRFVVAPRGSSAFDTIVEHLVGFNRDWAQHAPLLIAGLIEPVGSDGRDRPLALHDLGQAMAHLSVQAHADGLLVHQMAGLDAAGLHTALGLDAGLQLVTVSAIGALGDADALPEALRERETAPRTRLERAELVVLDGR